MLAAAAVHASAIICQWQCVNIAHADGQCDAMC